MVKLLIYSHAQLEIKNYVSAKHPSCMVSNLQIIQYSRTMEQRYSVLSYTSHSLPEQEGRTSLMVASWRGHLMTVMELLTAGANTDTQDQVSTCMHRIMKDSVMCPCCM